MGGRSSPLITSLARQQMLYHRSSYCKVLETDGQAKEAERPRREQLAISLITLILISYYYYMLLCVLTLSNPPDRRGAPAAPLYSIYPYHLLLRCATLILHCITIPPAALRPASYPPARQLLQQLNEVNDKILDALSSSPRKRYTVTITATKDHLMQGSLHEMEIRQARAVTDSVNRGPGMRQ
jgi:hypothetical protein